MKENTMNEPSKAAKKHIDRFDAEVGNYAFIGSMHRDDHKLIRYKYWYAKGLLEQYIGGLQEQIRKLKNARK